MPGCIDKPEPALFEEVHGCRPALPVTRSLPRRACARRSGMTEWATLWQGTANAWECDEMGHMNVRFYAAKVEEALDGLLIDANATIAPDPTMSVASHHIPLSPGKPRRHAAAYRRRRVGARSGGRALF